MKYTEQGWGLKYVDKLGNLCWYGHYWPKVDVPFLFKEKKPSIMGWAKKIGGVDREWISIIQTTEVVDEADK